MNAQVLQTLQEEGNITYEEVQVLLSKDSSTNYLSENLEEKLKKSELVIINEYNMNKNNSFFPVGIEEEELYHQAMKQGRSVSLLYLKVLAIGPGQVGKSTFLKRLTGLMKWDIDTAPKETQPQGSTGQAETQEVFISYSPKEAQSEFISYNRRTVSITASDWDVLKEFELEKQFLAFVSLIKAQHNPSIEDSESTQSKKDSEDHKDDETLEDHQYTGDDITDQVSSSLTNSDLQNTNDSKEDGASSLTSSKAKEKATITIDPPKSNIDKVIETFDGLGNSLLSQEMNLDAIINLEDIGGQPAFLEMLPSLTVGPALYLIFMKIIEGLKTPYPVRFRHEGDEHSSEYKDYMYTSEEVIFTALSSIACFANSDQEVEEYVSDKSSTRRTHSLALLMGTFVDALKNEEDSEKKVNATEKLLYQQLTNSGYYELIQFSNSSKEEILFRIDNKNGGRTEVMDYRSRLKDLMKNKFRKFQIPAKWLKLSICIKILATVEKKQIVSYRDCLEIGIKHCNMSEPMVKVALQFLHKYIGLVMYFPRNEALKDIVICDPQAVFSSITELIFKVYSPKKLSDLKYKQFVEKGQFCLDDVDLSDTRQDLLSIHKLVSLLVHLKIAVRIPGTDTYFLPAVLRTAKATDLPQYVPRSGCPDPLCISFRIGYLPLGFVCALVANLIAEDKFVLLGKRQNQIIYRNRMLFRFRGIYNIEMISWPKFCEFRVSRSSASNIQEEFHSAESCPLIRRTIIKAVDQVIETMKQSSLFQLSKDYVLAFRCPDHSTKLGETLGHEPVAAIDSESDPQTITCSECKAANSLTVEMKVWFGKVSYRCSMILFICAVHAFL